MARIGAQQVVVAKFTLLLLPFGTFSYCFLIFAATLLDLLFFKLVLHLSHVKQMYS